MQVVASNETNKQFLTKIGIYFISPAATTVQNSLKSPPYVTIASLYMLHFSL